MPNDSALRRATGGASGSTSTPTSVASGATSSSRRPTSPLPAVSSTTCRWEVGIATWETALVPCPTSNLPPPTRATARSAASTHSSVSSGAKKLVKVKGGANRSSRPTASGENRGSTRDGGVGRWSVVSNVGDLSRNG